MSEPVPKLLVHRGTRDSVNDVYGAATDAEIMAQPCVREALRKLCFERDRADADVTRLINMRNEDAHAHEKAMKKAREAERAIWTEAWECARGSILDRCIPMRADFDNDDINAVLSILDDAQPGTGDK